MGASGGGNKGGLTQIQPVDDNQATRQLSSTSAGGKKVPDKKEMGAGKP
jgi:hypothetical protein